MRRALIGFLRNQRGSHAAELCIWIPLFLVFLAAAVDGAMIYLTHTEMWNVARDTARRMTTRELDPLAAERHAFDALLIGGRRVQIEAGRQGNTAVVELRSPIADASVFGVFDLFERTGEGWIAHALEVRVEMAMEPRVL